MDMPDPNWHHRLHDVIRDRGENQSNVAKRAGVTKGMLSQWLKGTTRQPKHSTLRAVCSYLRVDMNHILYGSPASMRDAPSSYDVHGGIPITGLAAIGERGDWREVRKWDQGRQWRIDNLAMNPGAYAIQIRGDNLSPTIRDGWYLVVAPADECHPGEFVLVDLSDGRSIVRELLWRDNERIALMSVANGQERLTLAVEDVIQIAPVAAVMPPSRARAAE